MAARGPPRLRPPGHGGAGRVREPAARRPAARARPAGGVALVALERVRWIGGGSGAGKSTVALLLGERHGLPVVQTDLSLPAHADARASSPRVRAFLDASADERWVLRSPDEMLRTFPWFAGDGFDLLLEDLDGLAGDGPVLVEGFRLLPRLVAPLLRGGARGVWLLPTPARREAVMREREADGTFWTRTADPARALDNLLERDRLFTERVRADAAALRLPVVDVDGADGPAAVADHVARLLGLG